jgi:hypothetical protein
MAIAASLINTEVPADVRTFCANEGLCEHLQTAIALVERHFPPVQTWRFSLEREPENGEECAVIHAGVRDDVRDDVRDVDGLLSSYDAFLSYWVKAAPWPQRDKIRLSYYLA